MSIIKKLAALIFCTAVFITSVCVSVTATESDTSKDVSLTISYVDGTTPIADASFSIYLVATADSTGSLTVTEEFKQFNVNIQGENDSLWHLMASTLEGYVLRDGLVPALSGKTDENGSLTLPSSNISLKHGLYLILSPVHVQNDTVYEASPALVLLPTADTENDQWIYDVTVNPKFTTEENTDGNKTSREVYKVWIDDGNEEMRPDSIRIQLLKNGSVYDTVYLSEENNWRYSWNELEVSDGWIITEDVPEGYTVTLGRNGTAFILTNTYEGTTPPDDPTTENPPSTPPNLPQTGLLWWPVAVLFTAGLFFIVIGLIRRRYSSNEK